ncbi:condensin complex protein MksE [Rheinheimera fenheensis]|uniref:condensin complex protein MksE n=1 Tax=Rheinheimera fenheensis TaxID=3152295 RepID=UPI00325F2254
MNNNYLDLDVFASRLMYKDFIAGAVINKYEIIEGELQPSQKFRVLIDDIDKYRYVYSLFGYTIQSIGEESFFVTRTDRAEEYNEVAANIQVLLLVILRGVYSLGIAPGIMLDPTAGLSRMQIDDIGNINEQKRILEACKMKLPLSESVNSLLVNRGICFKTKSDRYILSAAGKYLFQQLTASANM